MSVPSIPPSDNRPEDPDRERILRDIQGKYAHVRTSSEGFAKRKMREIQREAGE